MRRRGFPGRAVRWARGVRRERGRDWVSPSGRGGFCRRASTARRRGRRRAAAASAATAQAGPPPMTALMRTPSILRVLPVVSPSQSSMPCSVVLVKVKWVASGLQRPRVSLALGGKVHFDLGALGNLAEGQGAVEDGVVQSVGFGIDAHTGDAQHGLRQFSNRGVADGLTLHREMASRADSQRGREG